MVATTRLLCMLGMAWVMTGCATPAGTTGVVAVGNLANNARKTPPGFVAVDIPLPMAASSGSSLSLARPTAIRVLPLDDDRPDTDVEGSTVAAFGLPLARIRFDPGPATLLGQVLRSEILAAGHAVVDRAHSTTLKGSLRAFEVHTDATAFYWDVIGSLAVSLQVQSLQVAVAGARLDYRARCVNRTYVWPSQDVIAQVMGQCLQDFATQLRSDGRVAMALRDAPEAKATAIAGKAESAYAPLMALSPAPGEKSYADTDSRWSVQYPGDWSVDTSGRFAKFGKGPALVGIHIAPHVAGKSLDEVADAAIRDWEQQMKSVNVVRRIARQHVTLAGDVVGIAITHHIGVGDAGKSRKVITIAKDRRFLIDTETYRTAWPDYERDFERILASFRVLD